MKLGGALILLLLTPFFRICAEEPPAEYLEMFHQMGFTNRIRAPVIPGSSRLLPEAWWHVNGRDVIAISDMVPGDNEAAVFISRDLDGGIGHSIYLSWDSMRASSQQFRHTLSRLRRIPKRYDTSSFVQSAYTKFISPLAEELIHSFQYRDTEWGRARARAALRLGGIKFSRPKYDSVELMREMDAKIETFDGYSFQEAWFAINRGIRSPKPNYGMIAGRLSEAWHHLTAQGYELGKKNATVRYAMRRIARSAGRKVPLDVLRALR